MNKPLDSDSPLVNLVDSCEIAPKVVCTPAQLGGNNDGNGICTSRRGSEDYRGPITKVFRTCKQDDGTSQTLFGRGRKKPVQNKCGRHRHNARSDWTSTKQRRDIGRLANTARLWLYRIAFGFRSNLLSPLHRTYESAQSACGLCKNLTRAAYCGAKHNLELVSFYSEVVCDFRVRLLSECSRTCDDLCPVCRTCLHSLVRDGWFDRAVKLGGTNDPEVIAAVADLESGDL